MPARVVWNSPLYDPSGYADEARHLVLALDEAGESVRCIPIPWDERRVELDATDRQLLGELEHRPFHPGNRMIHVQHVFGKHFEPSPKLIANVGRTMFETDSLPADWVAPCNSLDEIWVPSRFNVETFANAGVELSKLQVIPSPLDAADYAEQPEPLDVPGRREFAFLSVFDWSRRKGWDVLLRAFAEEFAGDDHVCLVLKVSSSAGLRPQQIVKRAHGFLRKHARASQGVLDRIQWHTEPLSASDMPRLYAAADGYVMASRGEGWGRPYMEAMAFGLPTIGTGWGGNTEFMDASNSWLVESDLVPVDGKALREVPQFRGHRWAEPRLAHLRECMREVVDDRAEARARGIRAREEVLARFDRRVVGESVRSRLAALHAAAAVPEASDVVASGGTTGTAGGGSTLAATKSGGASCATC